MKISHTLALSILTLSFTAQMFSQSSYLEKGQSGIGFLGSFFSSQSASGEGGSVGYSINSVLDFGISISNSSLSQKVDGQNLSAAAIALSITFAAIKQDQRNPVSLSLSAADLSYKYSSPALDQNNLTTEPTGFSLGASIYRDIIASPVMKVQPVIGLAYVNIKAEVKDNYGNTVTSRNNSAVGDLGCSLLFQTGPTTIIGVTPSLGIDKDNTTFDLSAGVVFIL